MRASRRYKITRHLGNGEFRDTYRAEDWDWPGHPPCAVKHLQPKTPDPFVLQRAIRLFDAQTQVLYRLGKHDLPAAFGSLSGKRRIALSPGQTSVTNRPQVSDKLARVLETMVRHRFSWQHLELHRRCQR